MLCIWYIIISVDHLLTCDLELNDYDPLLISAQCTSVLLVCCYSICIVSTCPCHYWNTQAVTFIRQRVYCLFENENNSVCLKYRVLEWTL